jgi:hypothetical protein
MRKYRRRRVAALAAAGIAAALLLTTNVAVALPAAPGSHGGPPAAGAPTPGTLPVEPNIPPCPSPPIIDRHSGPARPNSGNPCPPLPTPPKPPRYDCQLVAAPPNLRGSTVSAFGAALCDGSGRLILIVTLEVRPQGGTWREIARVRIDVFDYEASTTVSKACVRGSNEYRGVAQATINGYYAGKEESDPRGWSC